MSTTGLIFIGFMLVCMGLAVVAIMAMKRSSKPPKVKRYPD